MKIYTKTGDKGETGLYGGKRVPKHHLRVDAYGTLDELNAHVGLLLDLCANTVEASTLLQIQNNLFTLGSMLASEINEHEAFEKNLPYLKEKNITDLEIRIDLCNETLSPMTHFILPGGHPTISHCHICRTVCRRAERAVSALSESEAVPEIAIKFLNRLSDYLFTLARLMHHTLEVEEIKWIP